MFFFLFKACHPPCRYNGGAAMVTVPGTGPHCRATVTVAQYSLSVGLAGQPPQSDHFRHPAGTGVGPASGPRRKLGAESMWHRVARPADDDPASRR
eukprot:266272-Hanusia_phi.AAC.1